MTAHRIASASILLACALSANVHAAPLSASASASITNLTFTLIDLAPLDGIAPSMQFVNTQGTQASWDARIFTGASDTEGNFTDSSNNQVLATGAQNILSPNEINLTDATSQGSIVMTGSSFLVSAAMTMDSATAATGVYRYIEAQLTASPSDWGNVIEYQLSANTLVRIQGQYQMSAHTQVDEAIGYGSAVAALDFYAVSSAGVANLSQHVFTSTLDFPSTQSGSFDFYLGNTSTEIEHNFLYLTAAASVNLSGVASSVPEPTSVALMLAGLGVALVAARQRQSKMG